MKTIEPFFISQLERKCPQWVVLELFPFPKQKIFRKEILVSLQFVLWKYQFWDSQWSKRHGFRVTRTPPQHLLHYCVNAWWPLLVNPCAVLAAQFLTWCGRTTERKDNEGIGGKSTESNKKQGCIELSDVEAVSGKGYLTEKKWQGVVGMKTARKCGRSV